MTQWLRDQVLAGGMSRRIAIGVVVSAIVVLIRPAPWVLGLGIAAVWPVGVVACLPIGRRVEPVRRRVVPSGRACVV